MAVASARRLCDDSSRSLAAAYLAGLNVITLLKTYIDIVALRKGPEVIPASWLVLGFSLALLALAWVVQLTLLRAPAAGIFPVLTAYVGGLLL